MGVSTAIVPGSLQAIATQANRSIAESFVAADIIVLVDASGSMSMQDSRGGESRFKIACDELAQLQASMPGKIAVISFSDKAQFCPGGVPYFEGCGTNLTKALKFARVADVPRMRFILISDGEPNDRDSALAEAKLYRNRIDVIYVGPEDRPSGLHFLEKLAQVSGGRSLIVDRAKELAQGITKLLGGGT